jgi:hypothetical protein
MALSPGDEIPFKPSSDYLKEGLLLRVPRRDCRSLVMDTGAANRVHWPPREGDRNSLLVHLGVSGLVIPEPFRTNNFGRAGFLMRLPVYRTLCPWFDHNTVRVTADIDYAEGVSSPNTVTAPHVQQVYQWASNTTINEGLQSGDPPDDFAASHNGGTPWEFDLSVAAVIGPADCDAIVRVTATLTSTNYDYLVGTPVIQTQDINCTDFHDGDALSFFWTGVDFVGSNPVGLVRSMSLTFRGSSTYT